MDVRNKTMLKLAMILVLFVIVSTTANAFTTIVRDFNSTDEYNRTIGSSPWGGGCNLDMGGVAGSKIFRSYTAQHPCFYVRLEGNQTSAEWNYSIRHYIPAGAEREFNYMAFNEVGNEEGFVIDMDYQAGSYRIEFAQIDNGVQNATKLINANTDIGGHEGIWTTLSVYRTASGIVNITVRNDAGTLLNTWQTSGAYPYTSAAYFKEHINSFPSSATRIYNASKLTYSDNTVVPPTPTAIKNISINGFRVNISDTTIASSDFVLIKELEFNSSVTSDYVIYTAMNVEKTTGGGSNNVSGRIKVDGVTISTEVLRTVSSVGDVGSTGFPHQVVTVAAGSDHNITFELSRTGTGNVLVSNIDVLVVQNLSSASTGLRVEGYDVSYSTTAHDFTSPFNMSVYKSNNTDTFMCGVLSISGDSDNVFALSDVNSSVNSSYVYRTVTGGSVGSLGLGFISGDTLAGNNIFSLLHRSNDTVNVNGSFAAIDLGDVENNTVNNFKASNTSTGLSTNVTLSAGRNLLSSGVIDILNGTVLSVHGFLGGHSLSGAQTVTASISTNTSCITEKERSFSGNTDGAIFLNLYCNGLTVGQSIEVYLNMTVSPGESFSLDDEGISGFELNAISTASVPFVNLNIDTPANDTHYGSGTTGFDVNISGSQSSAVSCDLELNGVVNQSASDVNLAVGQSWTVSQGVTTGVEYNITVKCNNTVTVEKNVTVFVDSTNPLGQLLNPLNNSAWINQVIEFDATATDTNLYSVEYNVTDANGTLFYRENTTGIVGTSYVIDKTFHTDNFSAASNHTVWLRVADSHTANELVRLENPNVVNSNYYFSDLDVGTFAINVTKVGSSGFGYVRKDDRYSLTYSLSSDSDELHYKIRADKIVAVDSSYPGHLLINDLFWFDAAVVGVDVVGTDVSVDVDGKEAEVIVYLAEEVGEVEMDSIGEINIVEINAFFTSGVIPFTVVEPSSSAFYQNNSITINVSGTNLLLCNYSLNHYSKQTVFFCNTTTPFISDIGRNKLKVCDMTNNVCRESYFYAQKLDPDAADFHKLWILSLMVLILFFLAGTFNIHYMGVLSGFGMILLTLELWAYGGYFSGLMLMVAAMTLLYWVTKPTKGLIR